MIAAHAADVGGIGPATGFAMMLSVMPHKFDWDKQLRSRLIRRRALHAR